MAKQLGAIAKATKEYAGTAINTSIVAVTAGIEQLTTLAVYRCPCVSVRQLGENCTTTAVGSLSCSQLLNLGYGLSFIIAPAIGLLVFGVAASPKLWKSLTGSLHKLQKHKRECDEFCWTICGIIGQAMVSPITWVAIALLDGRYYACSATPLPYDVDRPGSEYANCEKVAVAKIIYPSDAFNDNRSFSQVLGWIVMAVFVFFGLVAYGVTQCTFPLTYYHAKYYKLYRQSEEAEFDDEMQKKAQQDAEANVLKFMEKRRSKNVWDKISTVYEFHRDKERLALYSHLHEWIVKEKHKEKSEGVPLIRLDESDGAVIENGDETDLEAEAPTASTNV